MKKKKSIGITALKARYGWICISPWILGLLLFFLLPICQSIYYSFCDVSLKAGSVDQSFIRLKNYKYIFMQNADYMDNILDSIIQFLYSFPVIIIISLILALILNQKFKGRIFFRAMYFLPVIIASGAVLSTILSNTAAGISHMKQDESIAMSMFDVSDIINSFGLPQKMSTYFVAVMDGITGLIWNCGVQIILFIAGMQSIPPLLYEVSKVEGATKWEEFWFITIPSLSDVFVLVSVFTMVELMTAQDNKVMQMAYNFMRSQYYGESSAMIWSYFVVIGVIMGIMLLLYNKFCLKRWD